MGREFLPSNTIGESRRNKRQALTKNMTQFEDLTTKFITKFAR